MRQWCAAPVSHLLAAAPSGTHQRLGGFTRIPSIQPETVVIGGAVDHVHVVIAAPRLKAGSLRLLSDHRVLGRASFRAHPRRPKACWPGSRRCVGVFPNAPQDSSTPYTQIDPT